MKKVETSTRVELLNWSHHRGVAKFEPKEQGKWLKLAEKKSLSRSELRAAIRQISRRREIVADDIGTVVIQDSGDSIADVPRSFNKRFWQIRKPISPWQFTTLIGRQTDLSENKKLDIVHLDSEPGRQYLKYAEVNKRQYEAWLESQREIKQQSLFGADDE